MEFLEAYSGGLRSPLLQFEKAGHPVVFRLFPTIHIGEPAYYASVLAHLADCDRVLYEFTETFDLGPRDHDGYRTLARRLGLTSQLDAVDYECVPATWVLADMTRGHLEQAIAVLPAWWERVQFTARGQAVLARLTAFLPAPTRQELAAVCDMSQTLHEDLIALTPLETLILDDRNRVLFNAIKRFHSVPLADAATPFIVGVFYGAAHMPAVSYFLTRHLGYFCRTGQWIEPDVFQW